MSRTAFRSLPVGVVSLLFAGLGTTSIADARPKAKSTCATAFEQAQEKQQRGRLVEARGRLIGCLQRACGPIVQRECMAFLEQVRHELPSVVLSLTDRSGNVLNDVSVEVDGALLVNRLDGRAVDVDPGAHTFVFVTLDGRKFEQRTTILQGLAMQQVAVRMPGSSETSPETINEENPKKKLRHAHAAKRKGDADSESPPVKSNNPSLLPYVLGGVGLLGVGGFVALGTLRNSAESELHSCAPSCGAARVDRVRSLAIAANASLAIGGAALATSLLLFLRRSAIETPNPLGAPAPRVSLSICAAVLPARSPPWAALSE
jgi:hypothetical protein